MKKLRASAHVNGADGTLVRGRGVSQCWREAAGNYHMIFPPGGNLDGTEHHFGVQPVNDAARTATLGNVGAAAPAGANAPAGSRSVQILTFDAAGAAADTDFLFGVERI